MKSRFTLVGLVAILVALSVCPPASAQGTSCSITTGTTLTVNGVFNWLQYYAREETYLLSNTGVLVTSNIACPLGTLQGAILNTSQKVCGKTAPDETSFVTTSMRHSQSTPHYGTWYGRCRHGYFTPSVLTGALIADLAHYHVVQEPTVAAYTPVPPPPNGCTGGTREDPCTSTPIAISLTKGELQFGPAVVPFDLDGNGTIETVAFPENGAWLAIDLNGDGVINSGRELIGSNTGGAKYPTGFEALAANVGVAFVGDEAGNIDTRGSALLLWQDVNLDGVSQPDELQPASNIVTSIGTGYTTSGKKDQFGTLYRYKGFATFANRTEGRPIYDVIPAQQ